jgi:hypothetical protein
VIVAPETLHCPYISMLIGGPQNLFPSLGAGANAVEDADRRNEAGEIRVYLPFYSQHMAKANLIHADSSDRSRRGQWNDHAPSVGQSIEP